MAQQLFTVIMMSLGFYVRLMSAGVRLDSSLFKNKLFTLVLSTFEGNITWRKTFHSPSGPADHCSTDTRSLRRIDPIHSYCSTGDTRSYHYVDDIHSFGRLDDTRFYGHLSPAWLAQRGRPFTAKGCSGASGTMREALPGASRAL